MKILNLYAGIGGNRKLWGSEHEITAVEYDPKIAAAYHDMFPRDKMVLQDAHEYLRLNYQDYDFIWSSPPCQTHSGMRKNLAVRYRGTEPKFPDMTLYEEIIFLRSHFEGLWVVENVVPYYEPLIPAKNLQRHLFWANFHIRTAHFKQDNLRAIQIPDLEKLYGYDLSIYPLSNKRQVLRNCVSPELGEHILHEALVHKGEAISKIPQQELI